MTTTTSTANGDLASHAAREALHEVRERRRRQDERLGSRLRIVAGTIVLYIPVVAIASSASGELEPMTAGLMLSFGLGFFGLACIIDYSSFACWRDGPDIGFLRKPGGEYPTRQSIDMQLVRDHESDYRSNERSLVWVTLGTLAFVAVVVLVSTYIAVKLFTMGAESVGRAEAPAMSIQGTNDCFTHEGDPSGLSGVNRYAIALLRGTANAGELDEYSHCEYLPVIESGGDAVDQ